MKKPLLFIFFLSFASNAFSQDLMQTALDGKSVIIDKIPFSYTLNPSSAKYYIDNLELEKDAIDEKMLAELLKSTAKQDLSKWTDEELKDKIVVGKGEKINGKDALKKLGSKKEEDVLKIKKQIKVYNSFENNGWVNVPIAVSRPVYSEDGTFAIIAMNFGNSSYSIFLYKKESDRWILLGSLRRAVY